MADTPTQNTLLRLFKRSVEVTLISQPVATPPPAGTTNAKFFDQTGNAVVITDLRVQFDIKKNLGQTPNTCDVTITNLAKETRGRLDKKPVYAILRAGHDSVLKPMFSGNINFAISNLRVPDWETKIQIADGGRAYSQARVNRSYAPPISIKQVLNDACSSMGLALPPDLADVEELKQSLPSGFSTAGPTRDLLTKLLAPYGYTWSIQGGRLQVIKQGLPNANTAWVIDVDAGMIGSPEGSVPHKPGGVSELSIELLLFPEICPGDMIQVTSKAYNKAIFRVNDVSHSGDTHGNEWKTRLKATPLGVVPPRGRGKK